MIEGAKELALLLAEIMSTGVILACGIAGELLVRGVKDRRRANAPLTLRSCRHIPALARKAAPAVVRRPHLKLQVSTI